MTSVRLRVEAEVGTRGFSFRDAQIRLSAEISPGLLAGILRGKSARLYGSPFTAETSRVYSSSSDQTNRSNRDRARNEKERRDPRGRPFEQRSNGATEQRSNGATEQRSNGAASALRILARNNRETSERPDTAERKSSLFQVEMRALSSVLSGHLVHSRTHVLGNVLLKPPTLRGLLQFQLIL